MGPMDMHHLARNYQSLQLERDTPSHQESLKSIPTWKAKKPEGLEAENSSLDEWKSQQDQQQQSKSAFSLRKVKPSLLTTEVLIHPALSGMQLNSHLLNHKSSNQCNSTVFPHISCSITLASSLLWQEEAKPEFPRGSTNMQVLPI